MNTQDAYQWNQLILAAIDGTISQEDFARLDQAIRTDPKVAGHYVEFMLLYAGLRQPGQVSTFFSDPETKSDLGLDMKLWKELANFEKTAETVEKVLPSRAETTVTTAAVPLSRVEHKISRLAIYTSIISVAALLIMVAFVFLNPRIQEPVGTLVKTVDAGWLDNTEDIQTGQELPKGRLHLERGLAMIRFNSGAGVILEGPARIELLGGNSMNIFEGKIVATVNRDAIGFVVNTPHGKVLDLGTEFGIQVNNAGQSLVEVFSGEVLLYPANQQGHLKISQGDAKIVNQDGHVEDSSLEIAVFVRQEEMDSKLLARSGDSYHQWKSFVFDLHRDPSLVAHYFDIKDDSKIERLFNTAPGGSGNRTGQFGTQGRQSPTWVTGRWPQKAAVRFERGRNQAIVIPANPSLSVNGPITISVWVYFPEGDKWGGHLISCREDYHVNFQFSVFDGNYVYGGQRNRFEFLRFNQKKEGGSYSQEFIQKTGVWTHLAVTHDMKNVCFYVNGQLFESLPNTVHPEGKAAQIVLGGMKLNGKYVLPEGDFDGIVDDLMIFNRCLGGDEIRNIYKNGLPISN